MRNKLVLLLVLLSCCLLALPVWADILCDGVDDQLQTPNAESTLITTSAATVMLWYLPTTPNPTSTDCTDGSGSTRQFLVGDDQTYLQINRYTTTGACSANWDGSTNHYVTGAITSGAWNHLTFRLSGGTAYFYVNGTQTNSTGSGNFVSGDLDAWVTLCSNNIGGRSLPAAGTIADVRYYNTALDVNEISSLGKSRLRRVQRTQPTAKWTLDQCADGAAANGIDFVDRSGNGRIMTANDGANNTGMTCKASQYLSVYQGVQ
jgi:hypothetical protein